QQEKIERALLELGEKLPRVRLTHLEDKMWVVRTHERQQRRQNVGSDRRDHTEPQGCGERLATLACEIADIANLVENALRAADDLTPRLRELRTLAPPLDELHAELQLQLL